MANLQTEIIALADYASLSKENKVLLPPRLNVNPLSAHFFWAINPLLKQPVRGE